MGVLSVSSPSASSESEVGRRLFLSEVFESVVVTDLMYERRALEALRVCGGLCQCLRSRKRWRNCTCSLLNWYGESSSDFTISAVEGAMLPFEETIDLKCCFRLMLVCCEMWNFEALRLSLQNYFSI